MAKMKEGSKAYVREALELALSRLSIYPCIKCGHPLDDGYCCPHCHSGEGSGNAEESHIDLDFYLRK